MENKAIEGPKLPSTVKVEALDLSGIVTKRRNMLDAELACDWDRYTADSTALGADLIKTIAVEAGVGSKPNRFNIRRVSDRPGDFVLVPTIEPDKSAVKARWLTETKVYLYLEKLMLSEKIAIPRGSRFHWRLERYTMPNGLPAICVQFSAPRHSIIQESTVKAGGQTKAATTAPTFQAAASEDQ